MIEDVGEWDFVHATNNWSLLLTQIAHIMSITVVFFLFVAAFVNIVHEQPFLFFSFSLFTSLVSLLCFSATFLSTSQIVHTLSWPLIWLMASGAICGLKCFVFLTCLALQDRQKPSEESSENINFSKSPKNEKDPDSNNGQELSLGGKVARISETVSAILQVPQEPNRKPKQNSNLSSGSDAANSDKEELLLILSKTD